MYIINLLFLQYYDISTIISTNINTKNNINNIIFSMYKNNTDYIIYLNHIVSIECENNFNYSKLLISTSLGNYHIY